MARPLPDKDLIDLVRLWEEHSRNAAAVARGLGVAPGVIRDRLSMAALRGFISAAGTEQPAEPSPVFEVGALPSGDIPIDELIRRREIDFKRRQEELTRFLASAQKRAKPSGSRSTI